MSELILSYLPLALTFILGWAVSRYPLKLAQVNGLIGEAGEMLTVMAGAVKDGKISKEEIEAVTKEVKETLVAAKAFIGR